MNSDNFRRGTPGSDLDLSIFPASRSPVKLLNYYAKKRAEMSHIHYFTKFQIVKKV